MRLKVFQSAKGDCLLITSRDGKRILVDGGMRDSYSAHVAAAMGRLRRDKRRLDLIYVSHIDQDHISGVLQLLDDLLEWRVFDFQRKSGNKSFPRPKAPRPPEIRDLWHNAFHDQIKQNAGAIEGLLATSASVLEAGSDSELRAEAERQRNLAASVPEAIELTQRVSPEQLNIPVNRQFGNKLILVRSQGNAVRLGTLKLTVIGPFREQLQDLRKEWNQWLREHAKAVREVRMRMHEDAARLANGEIADFGGGLEQRAHELGSIERVTAPNLASLMLLAEEGKRTVLLTGDGHPDQIFPGLEAARRLEDGRIHVDVLKVQHHCSEHNITEDFCRRVTADHYVFCANGAHENPDLAGLTTLIDSRLGSKAKHSANPGAERPFKLYFNSSSKATPDPDNRRHMRKVEKLVAARAKASKGRMTFSFLDDHAFELRL